MLAQKKAEEERKKQEEAEEELKIKLKEKAIKEDTKIEKEIAKDIMSILSNRDLAQRIAVEATEIFNGKDANFTEIIVYFVIQYNIKKEKDNKY